MAVALLKSIGERSSEKNEEKGNRGRPNYFLKYDRSAEEGLQLGGV